MEYRCLICQQDFQVEASLWRIRFLHRYAYEFYSDKQIQEMVREEPLNVSEVMCIEAFNAKTFMGVNALGKHVSIFE
ncbi:hypothetical protein [Brevibacillus sp. NRS-1366]|uniref:hypothetical protein n=1 Tax=Brevibacillus sp. NRS-1366 TaxID=3233899 RepID=UPI003D263124